MNMRTENWNGYVIRFVEIDGEWYAILKDICGALGLRTDKVADRLDTDMLTRVDVPGKAWKPNSGSNVYSKDLREHTTFQGGICFRRIC